MKPALLPIITGEKAMSSTPVTTDTHIARTFSPSCSPPEVCAKVCHWRSFRWLMSILQSTVSIAAAETHASNGQQPQAHEGAHDSAARAGQEPCVPLQADMLGAGKGRGR